MVLFIGTLNFDIELALGEISEEEGLTLLEQ